ATELQPDDAEELAGATALRSSSNRFSKGGARLLHSPQCVQGRAEDVVRLLIPGIQPGCLTGREHGLFVTAEVTQDAAEAHVGHGEVRSQLDCLSMRGSGLLQAVELQQVLREAAANDRSVGRLARQPLALSQFVLDAAPRACRLPRNPHGVPVLS